MDRDRIAHAVSKSRAHTQTDSLSVFLDLTAFSVEVTRRVLLVLLANENPSWPRVILSRPSSWPRSSPRSSMSAAMSMT